ncbi:transposase [Fodinibius halophilus]|uniref:Transposase n=1 Tax=Fodinibius halophilus TaxID=1736908 RepID=A0A6M1TGD9_9BACT|nr:transposase [Fodinibius halophilus]NGP87720.1 transposase [Fodinibius halophilus]
MSKSKRKRYTSKFKFQLVLESFTNEYSDSQLARKYGVHPVTLSNWKKEFKEKGPQIFSSKKQDQRLAKKLKQMERLLGQKEVEIAMLKNFLDES